MRTAWKKAATMAIVLGCGAIIAAQEPAQAPPTGRPEQPPAAAKAAPSKTMVTGCVQRAEASGATGTTGAVGAARAASAAQFTLTNAAIGSGGSASAAPSGAGGGADAAKSAPAGTSGSTYMLDDPSNKLAAHVGHKVEITGTLASAGPASASGATARAGQRLEVSEVKMVAATCSEK